MQDLKVHTANKNSPIAKKSDLVIDREDKKDSQASSKMEKLLEKYSLKVPTEGERIEGVV